MEWKLTDKKMNYKETKEYKMPEGWRWIEFSELVALWENGEYTKEEYVWHNVKRYNDLRASGLNYFYYNAIAGGRGISNRGRLFGVIVKIEKDKK